MPASFAVTLKTLSLGAADATGRYAKEYAESTIDMPILGPSSQLTQLGSGVHHRLDAKGYTDTAVTEGSIIVDSFDNEWLIEKVEPQKWGNVNAFYVANLVCLKSQTLKFDTECTLPPGDMLEFINYCIGDPYQHSVFYASGRWWMPYFDHGDNPAPLEQGIGMVTAVPDGAESASIIRADTLDEMTAIPIFSRAFSTHFDGEFFHYAWFTGADVIYYRRGAPQSDGTFVWSAAEQTVYNGGAYTFSRIQVTTDQDYPARPWIVVDNVDNTAVVFRANAQDGTFVSAVGFPQVLALDLGSPVVQLTHRIGADMYIAYFKDSTEQFCGKYYTADTGVWGSEEVISIADDDIDTADACDQFFLTSLNVVGDNIFCTYGANSISEGEDVLRVASRNEYTGLWTSEVTWTGGFDQEYHHPLLVRGYSGDLWFMVYTPWGADPESEWAYFAKRTIDGVWDNALSFWFDNTTDGDPAYDYNLMPARDLYGGNLVLVISPSEVDKNHFEFHKLCTLDLRG